ncbi:MAG TPA: HAD-IIB family hydrolase [Methanosarcinaceae archaeon]|nr:HAD-IIB family hydrolase [Methanosarcinaceae archaeon]
MKYIVFTDIDGTLIEHDTYSYEAAKPALSALKEQDIPLIFCTSKTRAEIEVYVKELDLAYPFISENGGAIFIPHNYFDVEYAHTKETPEYDIIELGTDYGTLRKNLADIRRSVDFEIIGFGDMDDVGVSEDTGLDIESARLAKIREYDEAFRLGKGANTPDAEKRLTELIKSHGLNHTRGGRYWHIIGDNDKGKAVTILSEIYRRQFDDIRTIGLGDSQNDLPMLQAVDIPLLVRKPGGQYDASIKDARINKVKGIGPVGWNIAILDILMA